MNQQTFAQDLKTKPNPLLSVCYLASFMFVSIYYVLDKFYFENDSEDEENNDNNNNNNRRFLKYTIYSAFVIMTLFVMRNTNANVKRRTDDFFWFFYSKIERGCAKALDQAKKVLKIN